MITAVHFLFRALPGISIVPTRRNRAVHLSLPRILCSIVLLSGGMLAMPAPAAAGPTAVWDTQWNFLPVTQTQISNASASSSGGPTGAAGELLPGTSGVVKAQASVGTSFTPFSPGQSIGEAKETFTREFTLSGSPNGWVVVLDARLMGQLLASNGAFTDVNPKASVQFAGSIVGTGLHFDLAFQTPRLAPDQSSNIPINQQNTDPGRKGVLSDGTYIVTGSLDAYAQVNNGYTLGGAQSLFSDTAIVGVSATAVPEPSTFFLFGTGIVGIVACGRRRVAMAVAKQVEAAASGTFTRA